MSGTLRAGAFESLTMKDCEELGKIRKYMDDLRDAEYGGHDTAHPEIRDTPESIFRLRKHALRPDMNGDERQTLRDGIRMLAALYTILDRDMTALLDKTRGPGWGR